MLGNRTFPVQAEINRLLGTPTLRRELPYPTLEDQEEEVGSVLRKIERSVGVLHDVPGRGEEGGPSCRPVLVAKADRDSGEQKATGVVETREAAEMARVLEGVNLHGRDPGLAGSRRSDRCQRKGRGTDIGMSSSSHTGVEEAGG